MKAIILAAGIGKRLGEISGNQPKCLLEFDGISLLHRHISLLAQFGITDILVICGYRQDEIKASLDSLKINVHIQTEFNPDYESGSVISLWTAHSFLESGDDIILMDADVLYDPAILQRLIETSHENCFLLDRDFVPGDEAVKICVLGNTMVDFRKLIESQLQFDYQGESVGFFRFNPEIAKELVQRCKNYIDNSKKDEPYEEVLRDLLLETPDAFDFEDVSGLAWIEIDFPEDVQRAQNEILSKIKQ
jgi:choline kinase